MLAAIQFHNQFLINGTKICEIGTYRMLASKFNTFKPSGL